MWSACRDALKEEMQRKLGQIATLGRDLAEAKNESTALQKQLQVCGNLFAIRELLFTCPEHCAALLGVCHSMHDDDDDDDDDLSLQSCEETWSHIEPYYAVAHMLTASSGQSCKARDLHLGLLNCSS